MGLIDQIYESAANAGLLKECVWHPSVGAAPQTARVGFAAPNVTILDGLALDTDYAITYPASVFLGLAARELVEIDGVIYQVRSTRAVGDGSEMRAQLTRV